MLTLLPGRRRPENHAGALWSIYANRQSGADSSAVTSATNHVAGSTVTVGQSNATYKPTLATTSGIREFANPAAGGFDIVTPSFSANDFAFLAVARCSNTSPQQWLMHMKSRAFGMEVNGTNFNMSNASAENSSPHPADNTHRPVGFTASVAGFTGLGPGVWVIWNGRRTFRQQHLNNGQWAGVSAVTSGFIGGIGAGSGIDYKGAWASAHGIAGFVSMEELDYMLRLIAAEAGATQPAFPTRRDIFKGDSLTGGNLGTTAGLKAYPEQTTRTGTFESIVLGVTGQTIAQAQAAGELAKMAAAYNTTLPCRTFLHIGTNTNAQLVGAVEVKRQFDAYLDAIIALGAMSNGNELYISTILPAGAVAQRETDRIAFNNLLLADFPTSTTDALVFKGGTKATKLLHLGGDATIGVAGSQNNSTNYQADLIHLTTTGYGLMAALWDRAVAAT